MVIPNSFCTHSNQDEFFCDYENIVTGSIYYFPNALCQAICKQCPKKGNPNLITNT